MLVSVFNLIAITPVAVSAKLELLVASAFNIELAAVEVAEMPTEVVTAKATIAVTTTVTLPLSPVPAAGVAPSDSA